MKLQRFLARHPLVVAVVLTGGATLALRGWWGWYAGRTLQAQLAEFTARGEPATWQDVHVTPVPDDENAWVLQIQAASLITTEPPSATSAYFPSYYPFGSKWLWYASESERGNQSAFRLAREARKRPRAQIVRDFQDSALRNYARLQDSVPVAQMLVDGALFAHAQGQDVEALERIMDALKLGESVMTVEDLRSFKLADSIQLASITNAQIIAPGLNTSDPAVRDAMVRLMRMLEQEQDRQTRFARSMRFERLIFNDWRQASCTDVHSIEPLIALENVRMGDFINAMDEVVRQGSMPVAYSKLEQVKARFQWTKDQVDQPIGRKTQRYARVFQSDSDLSSSVLQYFYALAERRVLRISLALQLYRADNGRWPAQLSDLTPKYLATLPVDPCHPDGKPMGYVVLPAGLPDGQPRPLVFYFGIEGEGQIDAEPMYGQRYFGIKSPNTYHDVTRWQPKVRRFDQEEADRQAEAEAQAKVEAEQRRKAMEYNGLSPDAIENKPGKTDAPGEEKKEDRRPDGPPNQ